MRIPGPRRQRKLETAGRRPSEGAALHEAAWAAGWKRGRANRALLDECQDALDQVNGRPPVTAVVVGARPSTAAAVVRAAGATVAEVTVDGDPAGLHTALAAAGPFDLILDDTRRGADRADRLRETFFHLRTGGRYVVRGVDLGESPGKDGGMSRLVARLVRDKRPPRDDVPLRRKDRHVLAQAAGRICVQAGHVSVTSSVDSFAKLREEEVDDVLDARGPSLGRVIDRVPGATLASGATVRSNEPAIVEALADTLVSPDLALREYADVTCRPGQLVTSGRLILPDTFRHNQRPRLRNLYLHDHGPRFAAPKDASEPEELAGSWFHLDSEHRGHFGHAMTEQLSRLWAWPAAKRAHPGLKALLLLNHDRDIADFERTLYAAAGIAPEDLVLARGPVRVERLLAATPMFSQPAYVHPEIAEVWRRTGDALVASATLAEPPPRIFCSRRGDKRACHNAEELEGVFRDAGFTIVYPEDHSMADQAALFREADVVAGYAGSAMFSLLYSPPKRVVLVSSRLYHIRNEHLIASVAGHEIDLVACEPDAPRDPNRPRGAHALEAGFTFDPQEEGAYLEKVLASLAG
ncbi:MAG: glycosyltransferase family 61 protein [Nocardioides sp.]